MDLPLLYGRIGQSLIILPSTNPVFLKGHFFKVTLTGGHKSVRFLLLSMCNL